MQSFLFLTFFIFVTFLVQTYFQWFFHLFSVKSLSENPKAYWINER